MALVNHPISWDLDIVQFEGCRVEFGFREGRVPRPASPARNSAADDGGSGNR
jgi:hypothetical protein